MAPARPSGRPRRFSAAIRVAQITHAPADLARVRRIITSLHAYQGPLGVFHTRTVPTRTYYDDNNWIALDLLDAHDLLHDPAYLHLAEHIFQFETTGWDSKRGGGIRWAVGDPDRNTVSTVPPIIIALRLAMITHHSSYYAWAMRLYRWENAHLRAPDGLYWDHLKADGAVDRRFFSYNQGLMIEANLAFAAYTGQQSCVREARRIASLTARLHPGPWHPRGMPSIFDAIYYQALARLNRVAPGSAPLDLVHEYLRWAGPVVHAPRAPRTEDTLFEQAAYVIDAAVVAR